MYSYYRHTWGSGSCKLSTDIGAHALSTNNKKQILNSDDTRYSIRQNNDRRESTSTNNCCLEDPLLLVPSTRMRPQPRSSFGCQYNYTTMATMMPTAKPTIDNPFAIHKAKVVVYEQWDGRQVLKCTCCTWMLDINSCYHQPIGSNNIFG